MGVPDAASFAEVARTLSDEHNVNGVAQRAIDVMMDLSGAQHCGVLVVNAAGHWDVVTASDATAARADLLQVTLAEGPGIDAAEAQGTVTAAEIVDESRWPEWVPRVKEVGVRCAVATSLHTRWRSLGALTVYSSRPGQIGGEAAEIMGLLAGHVSNAMDAATNETDLRRAADTRNIVGQAQGMLIERYKIDAREASQMLRRFAEENGTDLREAAERLL